MTEKDALDHAWRYFELHAGQRMASFNFFIVVGSLILTGFGGCLATPELKPLGVFLGATLSLTSLVFFFLDARTSFLIKHAEAAMVHLEAAAPIGGRLVTSEQAVTAKSRMPTYGFCFRTTFLMFGLVGLLGAFFSAVRAG
jgi:hypothetical protein